MAYPKLIRHTIYLLSLLFMHQVTFAGNENSCERYAYEAIRQDQANQALGAGFEYPVWSSNFEHHFNWCIQGRNALKTGWEMGERERALQEYVVETDQSPCQRYAREAVRQYHASEGFDSIDFNRPVWSDNFYNHLTWCLADNIEESIEESAYREQKLQDYSVKYNLYEGLEASFTTDFEEGFLRGWTKTGRAFDDQPTKGDNPTARFRGQPSHHQASYWIGTYESYQGRDGQHPGAIQGDGPTGTLTSSHFEIGSEINFLIGGGGGGPDTRVELVVDDDIVQTAFGRNTETMHRVTWDVSQYASMIGQIRIVDNDSGGWGHINFDDLQIIPKITTELLEDTTPYWTGAEDVRAEDALEHSNVSPYLRGGVVLDGLSPRNTRDLPTWFVSESESSVTPFLDNASVTIYPHADYHGTPRSYSSGKYDIDELGLQKEQLISVRVPQGMAVRLFDRSKFGGASIEINEDNPNVDKFWNHRVSSLWIYPKKTVTIYQHSDYRGRSRSFRPGKYDVYDVGEVRIGNFLPGKYDLHELGIGNDQLTSVRVPHGLAVRLFEHSKFGGASIEINEDNPNVGKFWNDRVSSLWVYPQKTVTIYQHSDYRGRSRSFPPGRYDVHELGIGNDQLTSVRVPQDMGVRLFKHAKYDVRGPFIKLDKDTPNIGSDWNDQVSSLRVLKKHRTLLTLTDMVIRKDFDGIFNGSGEFCIDVSEQDKRLNRIFNCGSKAFSTGTYSISPDDGQFLLETDESRFKVTIHLREKDKGWDDSADCKVTISFGVQSTGPRTIRCPGGNEIRYNIKPLPEHSGWLSISAVTIKDPNISGQLCVSAYMGTEALESVSSCLGRNSRAGFRYPIRDGEGYALVSDIDRYTKVTIQLSKKDASEPWDCKHEIQVDLDQRNKGFINCVGRTDRDPKVSWTYFFGKNLKTVLNDRPSRVIDVRPPLPAPEVPKIISFGKDPDKTSYTVGDTVSIRWEVRCPSQCKVALLGGVNGSLFRLDDLPRSGAHSVKGLVQDKVYKLVVESNGKTISKTISVRTWPKPKGPALSWFYFKVECTSIIRPCIVSRSLATTEEEAKKIIQNQNSNCKITTITESEYYRGSC